jgi:hypothetical protein
MKHLKQVIRDNPGFFDDEEPTEGHLQRFEHRLEKEVATPAKAFPWLKFAAAAILLLSLGSLLLLPPSIEESNTASPLKESFPLEEAEEFYTQTYTSRLNYISDNYTNEESKKLILQSQVLIENLESRYRELEQDLKETGDLRVAAAMIENYTSRIKILEQLITQLEYINQFKSYHYEKSNS